jgi:hypoxanthine phosphoribosyltransferase
MASENGIQSDIVITSKVTTYLYQSPEKIREHSWKLAAKVASNLAEFTPTLMVALWRGGAGVGMYMHEYLKRQAGLNVDHTAIRTGSYVAPGEARSKVRIQSLRYLIKHATKDTHLLIIDDIFDSGLTVEAFLTKLKTKMGENMPLKIRIATPYWKPENNKTELKPDYYVETVPGNTWIAFPHEISDFKTDAQLAEAMGQSTLDSLLTAKNA